MPKMEKNKLFQLLLNTWKHAFPGQGVSTTQQNVTQFWNANKEDRSCVEAKVRELKSIKLKRHAANIAFFHSTKRSKTNEPSSKPILDSLDTEESSVNQLEDNDRWANHPVATSSTRPSPAQEKAVRDLDKLDGEVARLEAIESSGLATREQICLLKTTLEARAKMKNHLNRLRFQAAAQKKFREFNKNNWQKLKEEHPELETELIQTVPSRKTRVCRIDGRTNKRSKSSRCSETEEDEIQEEYDDKATEVEASVTLSADNTQSLSYNKNRPSPAQERVITDLAKVEGEVASLQAIESSGLATKEQICLLKTKLESKNKLKNQLKRLRSQAAASKKVRESNKNNLQKLKEAHPELENQLSQAIPRSTRGRPRIEEKQPLLLQTIVNLVNQNAGADDSRSESLRCCQTLNDLHVELKQHGFQLSRSALYLRLLPRDSNAFDGKRHVVTVPVKLSRSDTYERKQHEDGDFAAVTIKYVKDLAETFGKECVFALSQDNKARVPLGLPAANNQAPILMHMDYCGKLPEHDWSVPTKHKLIPSVYAGLSFEESGKLSYSGPTYIAIRSGKHDSSTPSTHAADFRTLAAMPHFRELSQTEAGNIKPIVTLFVDGATDKNPRLPKVLLQSVHHFKHYNLDAMFVVTHAPRQSSHNPVERRMAALSRDLSAIVLPHEHYGTHLDSMGKTIDLELEMMNFKKAGQCLSEVWSNNKIDGYDVFAEYVDPIPDDSDAVLILTEEWKAEHVIQSQYLLQIVKCGVMSCCGPLKTNILDFLPNGKIPAPVKLKRCSTGVEVCSREESEGEFSNELAHRISFNRTVSRCISNIPFDYFCPSVSGTMNQRICSHCQSYFTTKRALSSHMKMHKKKPDAGSVLETLDNGDSDNEASISDAAVDEDDIHIIQNLTRWMSSPFELMY